MVNTFWWLAAQLLVFDPDLIRLIEETWVDEAQADLARQVDYYAKEIEAGRFSAIAWP